jgi:glycerol-3-phosphate acyltransferase PlsX
MGGDHAPGPVVAGAVQAVADEPELTVVLVGDQAQVEPLLPSGAERSRLEVVHCTQVIGMNEKPTAMRHKPDNSILRCWMLLSGDKVDGIVSAGNTGAMVAGGHFLKRFLPGVQRPGIAAVMPTEKGPLVLLDVGSNTAAKAEHLYQYAVMGSIYSRHILGVESPTVGLLNIGEEPEKGNDLAKETYALLSKSPMAKAFAGNVEGREIHKGTVDVLVCEGFVGNVVLKYGEGAFAHFMRMLQAEVLPRLGPGREAALPALQALKDKYDYATYGGAPLLGINGACIICHGSSKEKAIRNALKVASSYARQHLNDLIVAELRDNPPPAAVEKA